MRVQVIVLGVALLCASSARGESDSRPFRCLDGEWKGARASFLSTDDSSLNLYNGLLWSGSAFAVFGAADPPGDPRWSGRNSFDDAFRSGLKLNSDSSQDDAATASDAFWFATMAAPLLVDGLKTWSDGHCDESFGIASHWLESMSLTALLVGSTKVIAARERPGSSNRESFFSGHASLAATGAGLLCRDSIRNEIWGSGTLEKAIPCGLGIAGAVTTGMLRISGDKHWMTDVLVGWAAGALIGYFDLYGPFDLLRFRVRGDGGKTSAVGFVAPYARRGGIGAQISMQFY